MSPGRSEQKDGKVAGARRRWAIPAAGLLIVVAGLAVYANSFAGVFVFDDKPSILEQQDVWARFSPSEIIARNAQSYVLAFTLAVNYHISGLDVWSYHLFNVAIHVLAGLTLFGIVRRTLLIADCGLRITNCGLRIADCGSRNGRNLGVPPFLFFNPQSEIRSTLLALVIALLWLVHPVHTGSVTYIVQRAESLTGLFYLLTVYCALRARHAKNEYRTPNKEHRMKKELKRPGSVLGFRRCRFSYFYILHSLFGVRYSLVGSHRAGGRERPPATPWLWLSAAVVACALGMGTKPVMATAPVMVLLYDRTFLSGSFRQAFARGGWAFYLLLAATWLLLYWPVRSYQGWGAASPGAPGGLSSLDYARTQFGVVLHYLRLSFWPSGLCLDYGWPVAVHPGQYLPQAVVVLVLVGLTAALFFWKSPAAGFPGVWFFGILAPTSTVIVVSDMMYEHRLYLSLAAVVAVAVLSCYAAGGALLRRAGLTRLTGRVACAGAALSAAAVCALGGATALRNGDYSSQVKLWTDAVTKRPSHPRPHCALGMALLEAGQTDQAIARFTRALELKSDYADAYHNRGTAYASQGKYDLARQDFDKAVELAPCMAAAFHSRGNLFRLAGRLPEALAQYNHALTLRSDYAEAHSGRGLTLAAMGQYAPALAAFDEALRLEPELATALNGRGAAYAQTGRLDQAIGDFTAAIAAKPDYVQAYCNRGKACADKDWHEEALKDFNRALELNPDSAEAYNGRASIYGRLNQFMQAQSDCTRAIQLKGDFAEAYANRALAWYFMREYDKAWADVHAARRLGCPVPPAFLKNLADASGRTE